MKLLYITNAINGSGGLERVLSIKASYFADAFKYDVCIGVLNNGHKEPFYKFSEAIQFINKNVGGHPISYIRQYTKAIKEMVAEAQADIIIVCDDGLKGFFIPIILGKKTPIIYERHVSKLIELPANSGTKQKIVAKLKWSIMNKLAKRFRAFIVLTAGNIKEWQHLNNLHVIPNPLYEIPSAQTDYGAKKIICVGKVSHQKGQDFLAQIWPSLSNEFPEWELHNYGKLDEAFLPETQVPPKMYLHPPIQNIEKAYLSGSIYVLPSRYEGFGMVLIEAMSYGLPCVAFDCNYGPSDIIHPNKDGILVPEGRTDLLYKALADLMQSESERQGLGTIAKQQVKRYLIQDIAQKWQQLFKSL